jgi:hypothetical protein
VPTFGSDGGFQADNRGGIIDSQGNTIISADDSFGASPLGVAARTQALYGIPNANFNLTPPEPAEPIVANQNDLPYWSVTDESGGDITATSVFDATTQTYGVEINPGTADNGSIFRLSTRSYLLTDDSLALRQKALAVLAKSGTAAGTTQWALTLDCVYYSANDTALSTAVIGTALDTGTWTSLAGITTPGGSAINASAQYVDLTFTLTTTAAVTGSAKATIKSLLLATSAAATGSFLVAETFTSSTTWDRPTGVEYLVAAIGIGAGGGGGSGNLRASNTPTPDCDAGGGGGSGAYRIERDLYIGDQSSISIGIGSGGAGGTAITQSKAAAGTATFQLAGANGANGGATTFGSYFTADFGRGGQGASSGGSGNGGARGNATTSTVYGGTTVAGGGGGAGAQGGGASAVAGTAGGFTAFDQIPYNAPAAASGAAGAIGSGAVTGTGVGTVILTTAVAGGTAGYISGGGGGGASSGGTAPTFHAAAASQKGGGGSGGGAAHCLLTSGTATIAGTAGNGGAGGPNIGAGGGGGAGLAYGVTGTGDYTASEYTLTSGAGGAGSDGSVTVVYIA